ncbi:aldehyde dehydrogenase family protein [Salinisphaera sp. SPP-AMP-43]|uniref:aldehyde dehydrogenase family protein n=1 Tax=Salinisphaera sp. SPP-AMP-43 TaxID=3121288 RepID=UPI003C6E46E7
MDVLELDDCLPEDLEQAVLVGRVWRSAPVEGPALVTVRRGELIDISAQAPTMADLLDRDDVAEIVASAPGEALGQVRDWLAQSLETETGDRLLAPVDLQAVKACGVTFAVSLLERVIEEQAGGDPAKAADVRAQLHELIGHDLSQITPGSQAAMDLKAALVERGAWSQYLEVGIGPDAEVFSKCQPMASVGFGAEVGLHPSSAWNNPEPEIVLAVDATGRTRGATLGNDVNLRDLEGRSALLLSKAKDNNGSSSIGPFIRLFDEHFTIDDVRRARVRLIIEGEDDGFRLDAASDMREISRDPLDLVTQAHGAHHQYPDGFVLYLGTMFSPTADRDGEGQGFTHHVGDRVTIGTPRLGALINRVNRSDAIAPWTFGVRRLMQHLARRSGIAPKTDSHYSTQESSMPEITGQQFIDGQRVAAGSHTLASRAAEDNAPYKQDFFEATPEEVKAAANAAQQAFDTFSTTDPETRAQFLEVCADEIEALGDAVIREAMRETALPEKRLTGEVGRTTGQLRLFAKVLRRGDYLGARIDTATDAAPDLRQIQQALGPVAVFGASNFPFAFSVAGGDTASALAAGCPVVVKAHPGHMVTSEMVGTALQTAVTKTGMPAGTFNMIFGDKVGAQLVQEPAIKAVGFTGSQNGGRALFDLAAQRDEPIPVFAEMSSVNPMFMLPQAIETRGETLAEGLAGSVTMGVGQFCTGPGVIIGVKSPAMTRFVETLGEQLKAKPGQVMLNHGLLDNYQRGVERLKGLSGVAEVAVGTAESNQAAARLFTADKHQLFDAAQPLMEEVFGPSTVVVELDSEDELEDAARALNGQLTATVTGEETEVANHKPLVTELTRRAGRVLFDGFPTGVAVNDAMVHGGPYPATTDPHSTSVGTLAIERYLRAVCYQNAPAAVLPKALADDNPLGIRRLVNGEMSSAAL